MLVALSLAALTQCQATQHVIKGRFWFDDVTFELLPGHRERLGGAITPQEIQTIKSVAFNELEAAFAEFRFALSEDDTTAPFRVRVVQRELKYGAAGESVAMGSLGGQGFVSFSVSAANAIHYAPPNAERSTLIEAIGRGIGRAAAHEFAHQLVPKVNLHASRDPESYEYASANRYAEYYGEIHWDIARPELLRSLGARSPSQP